MRGQMLLIVVLVMAIVLTIALSVATRTITNVRVTNDQDSSERAFSAAEAGIEQAIGNNQDSTGSLDSTSSYKTSIVQQSGTQFILNNNLPVLKDDAQDLWFSSYPKYTNQYSGNVTVYWGSASDVCSMSEATNTMAALDIEVLSGTTTAPVMTHIPVDPCVQRRGYNNFYATTTSGTVSGVSFPYSTTFSITNGLIARIVPLYSSTTIGVTGCDTTGNNCTAIPSQGSVIDSVGTSGNAQRKIVTFKGYPSLPNELFSYVLFSPN